MSPLSVEIDGTEVRLLAPSRFHRERVEACFLPALKECLEEELGQAVRVRIQVAPARGETKAAPRASGAPAPPTQRKVNGAPVALRDALPLAAAATPQGGPPESPAASAQPGAAAAQARSAQPAQAPSGQNEPVPSQRGLPHSFSTFVVGRSNALAREASFSLARGRQLAVSPLYLVGPTGSGKTHLAQAVVGEARRHQDGGTVYASAEAFTSQLLASIRSRRTAEFKRRFRACRLLVLEDVQFLQGKKATQLELFHTLDQLRSADAGVVFTGDRLPRDLADMDPALRSRLASGLVAEIDPPEAELRRSILRAKAAAGGVRLPDDCLDRLVEGVDGSVRDLEGVLIQLVASASLLKQRIDLALTEAALHKLHGATPALRQLAPREVIETVAAFYGTTPDVLASRSRRRDVLIPRQIAMYLCHRYSDASLTSIARALGRDHPAASNAIAVVERAVLERAPLRYRVEELASRLDALARKRSRR